MEQIVVTRKDGNTTYVLDEHGTMVTSAKQNISLLEEDYVDIELLSTTVPNVKLGDHIDVFGRRYNVNQLPVVEKRGSRNHIVKVRFEGVQYSMARVTYMLSVDTTSLTLQDVRGNSLIGDIGVFLSVMSANLNRVFPGEWAVGVYPNGTDADTLITFADNDNCLSVLQTLCDVFDSEFDITTANGVNYINIRERNVVFPYPFKYGKMNGLYELSRSNSDSDNIINKMYVYGGTKNLAQNYLCDRLVLRNKTKSTSFIKDDTQIALNGVFEGVRVYDDIYPEREGTLTSIDTSNRLKVTDSSMFDLNEKWQDTAADYAWWLSLKGLTDTTEHYTNYQDTVVNSTKYLMAGTSAKLHFNSGNLAGYDFEVTSYDHSTHTFTLMRQTDERGLELPNDADSAFQAGVGDQYTLTDIMLPQSYITAAQQRLSAAAQADFDKLCVPRVKYELKIDELYIKEHCPNDVVAIDCGDYVTLTDADFVGSSTNVRVRRVERNLMSRYEYVLELEDVSVYRERRRVSRKDAIAERIEGNAFQLQQVVTIRSITNDVDFNGHKIVNAVVDKRYEAPSNPEEGQIYYNAFEKKAKVYDGYEFKEIGPDIMNAYGTCSDLEANNNKVVTPLHGFKDAVPGGYLTVHFVNGVRSNATMKVRKVGGGYTSDLPIYYNGSRITGGVIRAGDTALFTFSREFGIYGEWVLLNAQPFVPKHIEIEFYSVDYDEYDNYLYQPAKIIQGGQMVEAYTEDELVQLINEGNTIGVKVPLGQSNGREWSCYNDSTNRHLNVTTYTINGNSLKFLRMSLVTKEHPDYGEVWREIVEFSINN